MSPFIEIGIAMLGGAAGKQIGKSPITGDKPIHKILAPLATLVVGYGVTLLSGGEITPLEAMEKGTVIGVSAIGVYSAAKNLYQLIFGK